MEFGVFLNGYIPGPGAHETEWEHRQLLREAEYAIFADKHNWKYAWFGEHHGLTEYSHMSAPEVMMGYVAAQTDHIHLGTAIISLSPRKEHPVRYAERAAMLDHVTGNRFEWGTGRGAGSHELAAVQHHGQGLHEGRVGRGRPRDPADVGAGRLLAPGRDFTVPTPHNVLPKPYGKGHPPIWVACGNPPTFAKAGELGIGAIAFNFEPIYNLRGRIEAYKEAIADCKEPLGQFMNDNVMMTNAVICFEDRKKAREHRARPRRRLPRDDGEPVPRHDAEVARRHHLAQRADRLARSGCGWRPDAMLDQMIEGGYMMFGTPDEVSEQLSAYSSVGCDQIVFGLPQDLHRDEILELLETVRRQGDPRARPRPGALHRQVPREGRAEVRARERAVARHRVADDVAGDRARPHGTSDRGGAGEPGDRPAVLGRARGPRLGRAWPRCSPTTRTTPTSARPVTAAPGRTACSRRLRLGIEPLSGYEHIPARNMIAGGDLVMTEHTERWHFHTGEVIDHSFVSVTQLRDGKICPLARLLEHPEHHRQRAALVDRAHHERRRRRLSGRQADSSCSGGRSTPSWSRTESSS